MTEATTRKPFQVPGAGTTWPYIRVEVSHLPELRQILDKHQVRYKVDEYAVSFDGGPETTIIHLGRGADGEAIQAVLDGER